MRHAALEFARDIAEQFKIDGPLVEMGARAAEGQEDIADLRPLFMPMVDSYIGCDIQSGPGVDRVEDIHALTFDDDSVGTVLCFETLEHVSDPIRAVEEMHRVLKPGGLLAISSVMFFPIHEHPWDFWRFTPEGFDRLLAPFETKLVLAHGCDYLPEGVYGVGIKGPGIPLDRDLLPRISYISHHWADGMPVDFGPIRTTTRQLWGYTLHYTRMAARRRADRLTSRMKSRHHRSNPPSHP
jgi:SAM-dependent methyltransferase